MTKKELRIYECIYQDLDLDLYFSRNVSKMFAKSQTSGWIANYLNINSLSDKRLIQTIISEMFKFKL